MNISDLTDEKWFQALSGEIQLPEIEIPKMPSEQIQLNFTGASGKDTLEAAYGFYILIKDILKELNIPINPQTKLLDFGSGWGRIIRFWIKDIKEENLFGVDPLPEMITLCKQIMPRINFIQVNPEPPIKEIEDDTFNIVTAYSVFSHLNEEYTNNWFAEFNRVLKPGGLLVITTRSKIFIDYCNQLRKEDVQSQEYKKTLPFCFNDYHQCIKNYNSGMFVHQSTGGGGLLSSDFFGESCIPKQYFERFNGNFKMHKFIDYLFFEPTQTCAVLIKNDSLGVT